MTERDPFTGAKPRSFSRPSLATSQMSGVVCAVNWPRGCSLCGLPIIMSINPGTGNEMWCRNGLRGLFWEFGRVYWSWDWGGQRGVNPYSVKVKISGEKSKQQLFWTGYHQKNGHLMVLAFPWRKGSWRKWFFLTHLHVPESLRGPVELIFLLA